MKSCVLCRARPQYKDRRTGEYLCLQHAQLEVVAKTGSAASPPLAVRPAMGRDRRRIEELALYFWEEHAVECFDREYDVLACPAFLACNGEKVVGLASFAVEPEWDSLVLVMLNVLPDWQGHGGAGALLDALCSEAARRDLSRLLVATSNDDLPALALYQGYGFRILEVLPGAIAQHHGGELRGFAGIAVRDEIRLAYALAARPGDKGVKGGDHGL